MSVSPLLTVFGLLTCRAATVGAGDILLFLGLGLHLVILLTGSSASPEVDAIHEDILEV